MHKFATSPTMPPMRTILVLIVLALAACGGDDNPTIDAAPQIDAAIDAGRPVLPLTTQAYCDTIQAVCLTANAQYPTANQCLATAAGFPMGAASTEMTGDTLGCRIYHAQNAMVTGDTATHCPHAGPAGAAISVAAGQCSMSPCDAFCNLSVAVCGTNANPLVANHYADKAACVTACTGFAKAPAYSAPAANGNTMACKLFHLTNAALYKNGTPADPALHNTHCGHTLATATGVCI